MDQDVMNDLLNSEEVTDVEAFVRRMEHELSCLTGCETYEDFRVNITDLKDSAQDILRALGELEKLARELAERGEP